MHVGPSTIMHSSFDLVRLLDDIVAWLLTTRLHLSVTIYTARPCDSHQADVTYSRTSYYLRLSWLGSLEELHKTFFEPHGQLGLESQRGAVLSAN